jgi:hypothetical protein
MSAIFRRRDEQINLWQADHGAVIICFNSLVGLQIVVPDVRREDVVAAPEYRGQPCSSNSGGLSLRRMPFDIQYRNGEENERHSLLMRPAYRTGEFSQLQPQKMDTRCA